MLKWVGNLRTLDLWITFEDMSSANADCSVNFEGHGDERQEMELMMMRGSG